jgi:beta-N-acetylhexosaminidase
MKTIFARLLAVTLSVTSLAIASWRADLRPSPHAFDLTTADPAAVRAWGQHFIIGFHRFDELRPLAAAGAIAGIYITRRNLRGLSFTGLRGEITALQELRARNGLPALIIAVDQEGGIVSHLSPLLSAMVPLARVLEMFPDSSARTDHVRAYAHWQAAELAALGVTMNLGPVVDLKPRHTVFFDWHSRLRERAIDGDPRVVSDVAAAYCEALRGMGITPVLKHFPGLGRGRTDAHLFAPVLDQERAQLEAMDWLPFRELLRSARVPPAVMVTHVMLPHLDPSRPASLSRVVIRDIIRGEWGFRGTIVTDDFSMNPIRYRRGGVGTAAREAIAAGVDYVLISYQPELYREVMEFLLRDSVDPPKENGVRISAHEGVP